MSKTPFYGQPGPSSIFCASSTAHFYRPLPVANTITVEINFITAHAKFRSNKTQPYCRSLLSQISLIFLPAAQPQILSRFQ